MAEVNGKLVSCDRCNETVFLKCTGEGERDGGFTRWNNFEPIPSGWGNHFEVGLLCPKCNGEYRHLINSFMGTVEEVEVCVRENLL